MQFVGKPIPKWVEVLIADAEREAKAAAYRHCRDEANALAAQWAKASPGEGSKQYRLGQYDANRILADRFDRAACEAEELK